ncbi:MAG: general secretion pathway protein D [Flavobacteriales bacterium]|jgi:general secretion pathway protein D
MIVENNWKKIMITKSLIGFIAVASMVVSLVAAAESIRINFRDADIRSVIESVAEITGVTFVIDPRVKGKMTIISPEKIDGDVLYEVFLSALQVHGYQAVKDGSVVRIVPASQAFQLPGGEGSNQLMTKVLAVNHVIAAELVPVLKPLLSQGAQLQAHAASNRLVVTDTEAQIERVTQMLKIIDSGDQGSFEIIKLNNTSSSEALDIIGKMGMASGKQITVVEDEFNNRLILSGPSRSRAPIRALLMQLDVPSDDEGGLDVIYLHYAQAENMQPLLEKILSSRSFLRMAGETGAGTQESYSIQADNENNALVVAAPAGVLSSIKSVVRKLDQPRVQVLIEAVIAELSEDQANNLSIQLAAIGNSGAYLTNFDSAIPALAGAILSDGQTSDKLADFTFPGGITAGGASIDEDKGTGVAGLINALKSDAQTNILSTPSIMTLDNEEASISVGQEVPFITGSFTNANNDSANPFQTIEREEVGVKLKVTPQVNEGDAVRLEIEQEISSVLANAEAAGTSDLITSKRTISTNVMVNDGQLLVLGGLIGESQSSTERKVPFLGDIPFLGVLFRSTTKSSENKVLMVFIRPTILRNSGQASDISQRKYKMLRDSQESFNDRHGMSDAGMSLLPEDFNDIGMPEPLADQKLNIDVDVVEQE